MSPSSVPSEEPIWCSVDNDNQLHVESIESKPSWLGRLFRQLLSYFHLGNDISLDKVAAAAKEALVKDNHSITAGNIAYLNRCIRNRNVIMKKKEGDEDWIPLIVESVQAQVQKSSSPTSPQPLQPASSEEDTQCIQEVLQEASAATEEDRGKKSAECLQGLFRRAVAVEKVKVVRSLVGHAKPYIEDRKQLVRAEAGGSVVLLPPKGIPIVMKTAKFSELESRFHKSEQANAIIRKNKYTHLVRPDTALYKNFIIESRLPLSPYNAKQQIGLYMEHRDAFTPVVEEVTSFLCQSSLGDLLGQTKDTDAKIFGQRDLPRFDNLPLYLNESGEGMAGLVDFERFASLESPTYNSCCTACYQAIHFFPYHWEQILAVAQKFCNKVLNRADCEFLANRIKECFDNLCGNHLGFIQQHQIDCSTIPGILPISDAQKIAIIDGVLSKLIKEHKGEVECASFIGCLGENPEMKIDELKEIFPSIVDDIRNFLNVEVNDQHAYYKENNIEINSMVDLVCKRSMHLDIQESWLPKQDRLIAKIEKQMNLPTIEKEFIPGFPPKTYLCASRTIKFILNEMAMHGVIAYYKELYHDDICIFY